MPGAAADDAKDMASTRPRRHSRRLATAAVMLAFACILMLLLLDGAIYRATQGAEIGLYATILVLFAGVSLAGASCYLALTSLLRARRGLDNVIPAGQLVAARKERTKGQKRAA